MKGGSENLEDLSLKKLRIIIRELIPGEEERFEKIVGRIDQQQDLPAKISKSIQIIKELQAAAQREKLQKKINTFLGEVGIGSPGAEGAKSDRAFDTAPLINFAHARGLHDKTAEEIYGEFVEHQAEEIEQTHGRAVADGGAGGGAGGGAVGHLLAEQTEPAPYKVGDSVMYEERDGTETLVTIVGVNTNVQVGEDPDISIKKPDGVVRETTIARLKPVAETTVPPQDEGGSEAEVEAVRQLGLRDKEMPIGSRVWMPEFSKVLAGDYVGFTRNAWGANVHHIDFGQHGVHDVNLKYREPKDWKVVWVPSQGPGDRQVDVDQGGIAAGGSPGPLQSFTEGAEGITVKLPRLPHPYDLTFALHSAGLTDTAFGLSGDDRFDPDTRPVVTKMEPGPFADAGMVPPSLLMKLNEHDFTREVYEEGLRLDRLDKEKAKVINITFKNISAG